MDFYTIGVFNNTEKAFFDKLVNNNIDTFCDIRQRRGVRGSKYSFVNNKKLQDKLNELNIKYLYISGLAPTTEIRDLQKQADKVIGQLKTQRQELGSLFVNEYKTKILEAFDFNKMSQTFETLSSKRVALFCVEERAKACHRSLVAEKLEAIFRINDIKDL